MPSARTIRHNTSMTLRENRKEDLLNRILPNQQNDQANEKQSSINQSQYPFQQQTREQRTVTSKLIPQVIRLLHRHSFIKFQKLCKKQLMQEWDSFVSRLCLQKLRWSTRKRCYNYDTSNKRTNGSFSWDELLNVCLAWPWSWCPPLVYRLGMDAEFVMKLVIKLSLELQNFDWIKWQKW